MNELSVAAISIYTRQSGRLDVSFKSAPTAPAKSASKMETATAVFTPSQISSKVQQLNSDMESVGSSARLSYNRDIDQMIVNIIDVVTSEVIGSVPSEQIINAKIANNTFIGELLNKQG